LARFLALDWDHQQIHVVAATVRGGRVHIQRAAFWKEDQSPNPAEAEALGRLLRERLKAAGIAPAPVLACIGRDRVILKEVRYPAVAAADEPAVVRFQVSKELTDAADEVVIDYTASPPNGAGSEQQALALVIRRELLNTYETLCRAAGLKLVALTPRPFGALACWKQVAGTSVLTPAPEPPDAAVALLTVAERGAELCVVRGDKLLQARSLAVGNALAGEVRRSLTVHAGQAPQHPVRAVYVADSGEHVALRERLRELLGIPVHPLDPFANVERPEIPPVNRGAFASSVGLLHIRAEKSDLPINFVQPKKPRPPRDPNKNRLVALGGLAAALLLGGVFFCYNQLAAKDRELENLFLRKTNLEQQLTHAEEDAKRIEALDDWQQSGIVWLDEFYDLTDRFPDIENLRLMSLTGDPQTRTKQNKYAAKMSLTGISTEDPQAMNALMRQLVQDGHYLVGPKQVSPNRGQSGPERFRFRQKFITRVDIEKQPPAKFVRHLTVPAAKKGGEGDREQEGRPNGDVRGFSRRGDR
jgi:Tfp pilus assembly PilM family ATPase